MYPKTELNQLAQRKAVLRRAIALRRADCAAAASRAMRPLDWLHRALDFWKRLSPLVKIAAVPAGLILKRAAFPRFKILGALLRWGPVAFAAWRGVRSAISRP